MVFSAKQKRALTWWCKGSPDRDKEVILCDGAVRSGKTFCLGLGFFCWAMREFDGKQFALCGRTAAAVRRNLLHEIKPVLGTLGFRVREKVSQNRLEVGFNGHENVFYLFGGKDEASGALIQGVTLAGALLDEVALMPRSFVEQVVARCSEEGARLWFACNPEGPEHWFYREWILKEKERRAVRLHFTMEDNPAMSRATRERYARSFQGTFYRRFVLGEWVQAEGRVYDFFDEKRVKPVPEGPFQEWRVSCDYGTVNPTSMGLWGRKGEVWFRVKEFYYDARKEGRQKTDREYAGDLAALVGPRRVSRVIVDPSAASFQACLREERWPVEAADNRVIEGIRVTADLLRREKLVICTPCADAVREFALYRWDERARGDRVIKEHDHAMDDIRYFAMSLQRKEGFIGGFWVERR